MTGRTRAAGRYGARTSRSKSRMNSARSTSRGSIRPAACWSRAIAAAVSSSACISSAGLVSTATRAGPGPALAKLCTVPAGTASVWPAVRITARPRIRNRIAPPSTVKRSSCSGCAWGPGTRPPGARNSSHTRRAPPFASARWRMTIRSPLIGLSITGRSAGGSRPVTAAGSASLSASAMATSLAGAGLRVVRPPATPAPTSRDVGAGPAG